PVVVVVVEAPGQERATGRVVGEPLLVLGDNNPRHLVRLRLGRNAREEGHDQGQRRDCPAAHTGSLPVDSIPSGYSTGGAGTMSGGSSAMPPAVLTIAHSNHPLDRFLALLAQHGVEALVDIRRFPGSRKRPHFHRDNLAAALPKSGVKNHWLEA